MHESGEMYLETILVLGKKSNMVRAIDVAEEMGFSKASVSRAMANLRNDNCIVVGREGYIALTEKGRDIAEKTYARHVMLTDVLVAIGVDAQTAEADACRIEHYVSDETFEALKRCMAEHKQFFAEQKE